MKTIYEELSEERKQLQEEGLLPEWFSTSSWQLFSTKYLTKTEKDFKSVATRISKCAAKWTDDPDYWEQKFFTVIWNGWLSCATPVLANMGTNRGCPVSCSGNYVGDSIYDFYESQKEVAMLSKNGFGTSSYLGGIRPRGTEISSGGKASGVLPVLKDFVQLSRDVSQGNLRRGAWAGYIEIDHDDFWEIINFLINNPDDCNIGWIVSDKFIKRLNSGDKKAIARYQKAMKTKMVTGKGYFFFVDKTNKLNPKIYKDKGLKVLASQLCVSADSIIEFSMNNTGENSWKESIESFNEKVSLGFYEGKIYVKSYNIEKNQFEFKLIHCSVQNQLVDELYEIEYEEGKYIRCTEDHKILTKRGYVMAKDLIEDDEIIFE